jgi:glycosyltransferase involved in cell wall biosynthesis
MYLLVTHIPVFTDGSSALVETGWLRDVLLAREWLASPFGRLTLLAPSLPLPEDPKGLSRVESSAGIDVVTPFDERTRARGFWLHERARWMDSVRRLLPQADVVHASMDDLYRPMAQLAFRAAHAAGVPTVFVGPDMDLHEVWKDQLEVGGWRERVRKRLYLLAFDRVLAGHLSRADVSLLKDGAVHDRYARYAREPRAFGHTMYGAADVLGEGELESRIARLGDTRPLRLVYCGRLVRRKGVHVSLDLVRRAREKGAAVEFDVIGDGPDEPGLRKLAGALGLRDAVRFLGSFPYGPDLMRRLAEYDLLLFTPEEEDTPRMLYDGYAAGLPVLGTAIQFIRHRAAQESAAVVFGVGDVEAGAEELVRLDRDRTALASLMRRARSAGLEHCSERWFRRRREWTLEAVDRRRLAGGGRRVSRGA